MTDSERQGGARDALIIGVENFLVEWEQSDDLSHEGAAKIVDWILASGQIQDALKEGNCDAHSFLRGDDSPLEGI